MLESVIPPASPQAILIAAPPWYDCTAALGRLTRLLEPAGVPVEHLAPAQLDARLWRVPTARALVLHPSAEDCATAAVKAGDTPTAAIMAWTRHSVTLVLQCRRLGTRCAVLDPHGVADDDGLSEALAAHLDLPLESDTDDPHRSREDTAAEGVARFICRLAALEEPAVHELSAALRPFTLALWSAPIRTTLDEALAAHQALAAGTSTAPATSARTASDDELAAVHARLAEAEGQNALLLEQIALLQEAVGASIFDGATAQHQTIYADEGLTHPAFYPPERRPSDGLSLRWIGNEDDAILPTDISRTRPLRVDVQIAVSADAAALDGFSVTCDGIAPIAVTRTRTDDGSWLHSSTFAPPQNPDPLALVRLGLHIASKVDLTDKGDPRSLAVGIHKIEIWQLDADREDEDEDGIELGVDSLTAPAFSPVEALPSGERFRWMGQEKSAILPLMGERRGAMRVEVHMPLTTHRRCVEELAISLDGAPADRVLIEPLGDGGAIKSAIFEAGPGPLETLSLTLGATADEGLSEPGSGEAGDGTRTLRVAIGKIVVRPA